MKMTSEQIAYLLYAGGCLVILLGLLYVAYTLGHWDDWRYKK